ncbi:MAG TPA: MotA/TolQ/ExbB proton channel family protein [Anaeromyxobacteraceae bacterium]|nr:MotA/TolQ/ExbB proton channel family protein [Anaeromyxobacteraceae bacterium]
METHLVQASHVSVTLWIIIACSVIAIAVAVERAVALWRFGERTRQLGEAVAAALRRGDLDAARLECARSRSPMGEVLLAGLAQARGRPGRAAAAVERARQELGWRLRRALWILATVGATAPFVGLFGTVLGIMSAFGEMARTGQGGFAVVAAGISEALVTTAGGIAVAIEAVVLYNFLNTHVARLAQRARLAGDEFLEALEEAPAAPRAPGSGG